MPCKWNLFSNDSSVICKCHHVAHQLSTRELKAWITLALYEDNRITCASGNGWTMQLWKQNVLANQLRHGGHPHGWHPEPGREELPERSRQEPLPLLLQLRRPRDETQIKQGTFLACILNSSDVYLPLLAELCRVDYSEKGAGRLPILPGDHSSDASCPRDWNEKNFKSVKSYLATFWIPIIL